MSYLLQHLLKHGLQNLSYRSLSKFKLGKLKKTKIQEKFTFEVICTYDVYTETEFMHSPNMEELYTEHYKDKFILDSDFRILEVSDKFSKTNKKKKFMKIKSY